MRLFISGAGAALLLALSQPSNAAENKLSFSDSGFSAERALIIQEDAHYRDYIGKGMMRESDISIALADLNGDGKQEIFAYTQNSLMCGANNCSLAVYEKQGDGLKTLLKVATTPGVGVSSRKSHGMSNVLLDDGFGHNRVWKFNGMQYAFTK